MKISVYILITTNIITLLALFYWNPFLAPRQIRQEFLLITPITFASGHFEYLAAPSIFRSVEECEKTLKDLNSSPVFPGASWRCKDYAP